MNTKTIAKIVAQEEMKHSTELRGASGKSQEWEDGFVAGLRYVRENLLTLRESDAIEVGHIGQSGGDVVAFDPSANTDSATPR